PAPCDARGPLAEMFTSTMDAIGRAQTDVLGKLTNRPARTSRHDGPREVRSRRTFSLETLPEVLDHCFFRQPVGWSNVSDRHPVVPMTTSLELMIEAARELAPGRVVVGMEKISASRWLVVASPVDVEIVCRFDGASRVHVSIEGYSEGTVVFGDRYAPAPAVDVAPLADETAPDIDASRLYTDRWMFHGPAFAGITSLGPIGTDGIRGVIDTG